MAETRVDFAAARIITSKMKHRIFAGMLEPLGRIQVFGF
jgi:hypothetical protein